MFASASAHPSSRVARGAAVLALLLLATTPLAAQRPDGGHGEHGRHAHAPVIGTIVWSTSARAAAREPFLRGVAYLHSFEYEDAAESFRAAQKADPAFALAYWGEAMTYSHIAWGEEDLDGARAALARLAPSREARLAKASVERERRFGAAVEALFAEGTVSDRARAWADSMRGYVASAPGDQEAAAFTALALFMHSVSVPPAEARAIADEAAAHAQRVLDANPKHPGAAHYLIHVYDSPATAKYGLAAARAYDRIAPDADHALHMPSHIYLQLGLWDDVAGANERAWAASRAWVRNRRGTAADVSWHSLHWLQYAYLQQGRWRAARALIDTARTLLAAPRARSHPDAELTLARLEFQYRSETGTWEGAPPLPSSGTLASFTTPRARMFLRGYGGWRAVDAARRGDTAAMEEAAPPLLARADSVRAGTATVPPAAASTALLVAALVAELRGDGAAAAEWLGAAAEAEPRIGAFLGPPDRLFALELLGERLLARGDAAGAAAAYAKVLELCPRRAQALRGLVRAKVAAGDATGAEAARRELRDVWKRADREVLALLP